MRRDENGVAVPDEKSPLVWFADFGNQVYGKNGWVADAITNGDAKFVVHAANYHARLAEIVRRLAENEEMTADQWVHLIVNAKELWAEMKGAGNE